ncbi:MAG: glycosyltransferase family 4 protein [Deltaproteobacteria bacterium]|nr:glycosyltransferase family 4 protein [Deltaproteobacteria bacterium]
MTRPGSERRGRPFASVVHIITLLEWGGAQENTLYTVTELDSKRYERVLLSGRGGMLDTVAETIPGCRFRPVNSLVREIRPLSDLRAFASLTAMLREEKRRADGAPLVVHTHSSKAGILGRAAARAAGADVVIHSLHGFGFHDGQPSMARKFFVGLERAASRWTDMFVAVSEENIRLGVKEGIFNRDRCRLIRSGFDTGRFTSGSREEGRRLLAFPGDAPVVGTVAVFKHQKAPLDFVEVARRVAREVPNARFVMVGDGELRPEVERALANASLSDRFLLMGWRGEIPDLLRAFDVFLLTSRWEGLPKVVPQALISGVPVVATAVDGTREIVDDGKDGFLCPPGDVEGLAGRVVSILTGASRLDPSYKRDRLLAEFHQTEMVRAQERLYEELLSRKGFPCPGSS